MGLPSAKRKSDKTQIGLFIGGEVFHFGGDYDIIKTKIKFTYEPIPEIFNEISKDSSKNISKIFEQAKEKLKEETANIAWEQSIEESKGNLKKEDKQILKTMSKLLGQTDVEGQISQIEITENFLENQITEAMEERQKNEKLYKRL